VKNQNLISKIRNEVFVVEQNCVYQECDDKDKKAYHNNTLNENEARISAQEYAIPFY